MIIRLASATALIFAAFIVQGCAAVALTPALGGAMSGGTSAAVKAGTEMTSGGVAFRTFSQPIQEVHEVTVRTLQRLAVKLRDDEPTPSGYKIQGIARGRKIDITLERLTAEMTQMKLVVKRGVFSKDRSTTSELLTQVETTLSETPAASPR